MKPSTFPHAAPTHDGDAFVNFLHPDAVSRVLDKSGRVTQYRIASKTPREVKVSVNADTKTIQPEKSKKP